MCNYFQAAIRVGDEGHNNGKVSVYHWVWVRTDYHMVVEFCRHYRVKRGRLDRRVSITT